VCRAKIISCLKLERAEPVDELVKQLLNRDSKCRVRPMDYHRTHHCWLLRVSLVLPLS
jgi:hypothetical protein